MADDRNCTECKHHVPLKPGSDIYGCEKWECEFEPKETEQVFDKLEKCPFCGGEATLEENQWCADMQFDYYHDLFFVQCSNCKASGTKVELLDARFRKTCRQELQEARKKAIDAWNTRTEGKE